jgi:hypothetical protein
MSREDFNQTWLFEMPEGLGNFDTYDMLEYNIKELLKNDIVPKEFSNGVKKIELNYIMYYWIEDKDGTIILGVNLEKKPQALVVGLTGKNPRYKKRQPYASELYKFILDDNKTQSLRLMSDQSLSDEGKSIWDRLFKMGLDVSVYDKENPGKSFITFKSSDEMNQYFRHDDTDFKRYQYVLSEGKEMLAETQALFNIRWYREQIKGML